MKENEIQIGDWVRRDYGGEVKDFRVDSLIRDHTLEIGVYGDRGFMGYADQIEPVPLTAEMLERNGFKHIDIPFSPEWELFGVTIYRGDGRFYLDYGTNMSMEIMYVHQLQHLLLLCGIIRDIVL